MEILPCSRRCSLGPILCFGLHATKPAALPLATLRTWPHMRLTRACGGLADAQVAAGLRTGCVKSAAPQDRQPVADPRMRQGMYGSFSL